MEESQKHPYDPPVVEVVEVNMEGIICQSGVGDYNQNSPITW